MPDKINKKEMAAQYGFALAFMNSNPELKKLFTKAVKQTWTPDKFVANLRGTKWFKKHSASVRNAILQKTADPATYKANVDQMYSTVRDAWGKTFGAAGLNEKHLRQLASQAHMMGWSEAQLMDHMSAGIDYQKFLASSSLGGQAAQTRAQLDSLISNYGVDLGNTWKAGRLERILEGDQTIEGVQDQIKQMAKQEYKAFAEQIDSGATVNEIADPYRQKMADLLEMNPNDIGVKDSYIQKALRQTSNQGHAAAMDYADFTDMVRQDNRWQYTDNAKKQVAGVTEGLLRNFGLIA